MEKYLGFEGFSEGRALYRVGNGANFNIWEDPQVLDGDSHFITSVVVDGLNYVL